MRNAILISLAGILLVSLITIGIVYAIPQKQPPELSPSSMPAPPVVEDTTGYPYLLRTYEGKLAIFTNDLVTPDLVFDVYVKTLPEYDREELERGVRVEDYEKLIARIEDYIS
ncbi:MAG: hypothetical protein HFG20_01925 [Anaerotruncus sp.]|jgi:hypothetical protein|nr:hypothetical protein [Anaerotruncus sp.]